METYEQSQDRLFAKSRSWLPMGRATSVSRRALLWLSKNVHSGSLEITEGSDTYYFGDDRGQAAKVEVLDPSAWQAILLEGSAGLGRGYINGWWTSDDLTAVVQVLDRAVGRYDRTRNALANIRDPFHNVLSKAKTSGSDSAKKNKKTDKDNIGAHYDVGNEFFKLFLDETMTYSSGIFESADESMVDASLNKYDRLLETLGVDSGANLIEIGTGWGGFTARAVEKANAAVTTTTISDEQFDLAAEKFKHLGIEKSVDLLKSDWRDLTGQFDYLVSIEMIEAVHWLDYPAFFSKIADLLVDGGSAGIQAICVPHENYTRIKQTKDFIRTFVFPGGFLPSTEEIRKHAEASGLELTQMIDITPHYSETLRRWRSQFEKNLSQVEALGLDEKFQRLWRFYLCYCEAAFNERSCTVNQIYLKKAS